MLPKKNTEGFEGQVAVNLGEITKMKVVNIHSGQKTFAGEKLSFFILRCQYPSRGSSHPESVELETQIKKCEAFQKCQNFGPNNPMHEDGLEPRQVCLLTS